MSVRNSMERPCWKTMWPPDSEQWPDFYVCFIRDYRLDELLLVVAESTKMSRADGLDDETDGGRHLRVLCRRLMNWRKDVMAVPHKSATTLAILMDRGRASDPYLRLLLDKMQLKPVSTQSPTLEQVERCWAHWITIQLSSQYSVLAGCLVGNRHFLDPDDEDLPLKCVQVSTHFVGRNLEIWAKLGQVRVFPVGPDDIHVDPVHMEQFTRDPTAVLRIDPSRKQPGFFYLPKLRSGKLISISRCIPSSAPFRSYAELSQYWDQTYGYRLPQNHSELVYFNVEFKRFGHVYTYPSCCVYSRVPEPITSADPQLLLQEFWFHLVQVLQPFKERLIPILRPLEFMTPSVTVDRVSKTRRPWFEKISKDVQDEEKMRRLRLQPIYKDSKVSPYFPQVNKEDRPRLVNTRITEYFNQTNPTFKRPLNKIPFQGSTVKEKGKKSRVQGNIEDLARAGRLERIRIGQLRVWLQQQDIPFHPKAPHYELCQLIYDKLARKRTF